MKSTSSLILIVLFASGFCADDTTSIVNPTTETTTTSVQTTTIAETTSRQPDTTTVSPSTSTITTSTEQTTATLPDTTTTTSLPDTTTSRKTTMIPPVTTKSPEPPIPVEGSWNVTEDNSTCIRADLKVRFRISIKDNIEYIVLSPNAASRGNCNLSDVTQELQLQESEYSLTFIFEKDSNNAYLKNITFTFTLPEGSGMVYNDTRFFTVKVGNSYMCESSNNINFENVTMEIFRIHIQSFGSIGNQDFGIAEECEADNKVNDMVPIAVGIALLVLVIVVLVAYFVGRRRSRQKGYQSV